MNGWITRAREYGVTYKHLILLFVLHGAATIVEAIGLGIFLPIFQYISVSGDVSQLQSSSKLWYYITNFYSMLGVSISLVSLLFTAFFLFLLRQIFVYIRIVYESYVKEEISKVQRDGLMTKYLDATAEYHDTVPIGKFVNTITTELRTAVISILAPVQMIGLIFISFVYIIILASVSFYITVGSIFVIILAVSLTGIWVQQSKKVGKKLTAANNTMAEYMLQRLKSPIMVRMSGTTEKELKEYRKLIRAQMDIGIQGAMLRGKTEITFEPVVIGISCLFIFLAVEVMKLSIHEIGFYLVITLRLVPVIKSSVKQWQVTQSGKGPVENVSNQINQMEASKETDNGNKSISEIHDRICISEMSYFYPQKKIGLTNVSLDIVSGIFHVITGASGSGKSTLVELIARVRHATNGSILYDNVDIEDLTEKSIRSLLSYGPQNPTIFNISVRDHISYGKTGVSLESIKLASVMAGAHEFIESLNNGYDTVLDEEGKTLSGGQIQRLDLARALIGNSSIVILDEPTSNIDRESARSIIGTIKKVLEEKISNTTFIVVSHDPELIREASNVIVLEDGKVNSVGTHVDLMGSNEWYRQNIGNSGFEVSRK